jgi:hypothetical protein
MLLKKLEAPLTSPRDNKRVESLEKENLELVQKL